MMISRFSTLRSWCLLLSFATLSLCCAQTGSRHYQQRLRLFAQSAAVDSGSIVLLGNSLTEGGGDWGRRLGRENVRNFGISGDDAWGMLQRLHLLTPQPPKAIFLMVGINDLSHGLSVEQVVDSCCMLIEAIATQAPQTQLCVQSLLPIDEGFGRWKSLRGATPKIPLINTQLEAYCRARGIAFLPLWAAFCAEGTQTMAREFCADGLHLTAAAYQHWAQLLLPYVAAIDQGQRIADLLPTTAE